LENKKENSAGLKNPNDPISVSDLINSFQIPLQTLDNYLLNVLMDNIPDSIYFKDLESRFIKVNKGIMKYAGVSSEEEILGKTDFDFFGHEHASEARKDELEIIKTGKPIINKVEKENFPDGRIEWVSTTKIPLRDSESNIIGTFGMSRNITDLIQKEQKINKIAHELAESNEKLKESEQELKASNASKDTLFSIISHDLRNPFGSVLSLAEFLIEDISEMPQEEIQTYAKSIHEAAETVYKLLNNLLEWSRLQTGKIKYNPEKILLKDFTETILKLYEANLENKNIAVDLNIADDIAVYADANILNTVLRNLISNAIKFSFVGSRIIITSGIEKDECIVFIKDNGTGISNKDFENIFKVSANKSKKGTADEEGTGLGLVLTKEFVELNKGRIWFESEEEKGTTFCFCLPVCKD
jgi:PAS domain S-box-containing protein